MKKVLVGLLILPLLLLAAALVVPSFIDWNEYKSEIAAWVKAVTGRDLLINGDIRFAILPAPALTAHDVSFANLEGGSAAQMARLSSLEVRIALGPLLGGQVQVETVKLVDPVIELEVLADGRRNWDIMVGGGNADTIALPPRPGGASGVPSAGAKSTFRNAVRLDNFVIENGALTYRDGRDGTVERLGRINATVEAVSLDGPFRSSGSAVVRGVPLSYEVTLGPIIHGRTVSLSLKLVSVDGTTMQAAGTLVNLSEAPAFKGKIKGEGKTLAGLIEGLAPVPDLPGFLVQKFGVDGDLAASATQIRVRDLSITLGESRISGELDVTPGPPLDVKARLSVNRIDLDGWLAMSAKPAASEDRSPAAPKAAPAAADPVGAVAVRLPADVSATVDVTIDMITFRGRRITRTRLGAELAGGEVTVHQLAAQAPGSSDVAVFGFLTVADGEPRFDGEVETVIGDLRGVLDWLGVDASTVPSGRLHHLRLKAGVSATRDQVELNDIDLEFDASRLTGAAVVALRKRPSFGANLNLDRIDVDAYLPGGGTTSIGPPPAARGSGGASGAASADATDDGEPPNPLAPLAALTLFDANLKVRVESLVHQGTPVRDVLVDATLYNGTLTLRRVSAGDLVGAKFELSGALSGLNGVPRVHDLKFAVITDDARRLLRFAGIAPPAIPKAFNRIAASGRMDGLLLSPGVELTLAAAGAEVEVAGGLSIIPKPSFEGTFTAKHGDVGALLRALEVAYRPRGKLGDLNVATRFKVGLSAIELSDLKGRVGTVSLAGGALVEFGRERPKVTANVNTGEIVIDPFLPVERTASRIEPMRQARPLPATFLGPAGLRNGKEPVREALLRLAATGNRRPWPTEPIDVSALGIVDADLHVRAPAVVYGGYRFENADVTARITKGVLDVERFTGVLFGGPMDGRARVQPGPRNRIDVALNVENMDLAQALAATGGGRIAAGRLTTSLDLSTRGLSVADMVSTVRGTGSFSVRDVDVRGNAKGSVLAGVLGLVRNVATLGGALGGGKTGNGLADVTGTFKMENGVARSDDIRLVSNIGEGHAQGTVDLPRWLLDVKGEIRLGQSVLTQVLGATTGALQTLPFHVRGRLDAPNVKLDTGKLTGAGITIPGIGIPIPGTEKLLKKKGVGEVIQGIQDILGGVVGPAPEARTPAPQAPSGQSGPPAPPPSQTPGRETPERQTPKPEDLLKQLFKIK